MQTRSTGLPSRSYRGAAEVIWSALTGRLFGSVLAPPVDRALDQPAEASATSRPAASTLVIRRIRHESALHFILSGELDLVTAEHLKHQCQRVDPTEVDTVLLDLADLTTIDSSGVDVLFDAYAHLGEQLVIIIGPGSAPTIDLAKVRDQLPIIEG